MESPECVRPQDRVGQWSPVAEGSKDRQWLLVDAESPCWGQVWKHSELRAWWLLHTPVGVVKAAEMFASRGINVTGLAALLTALEVGLSPPWPSSVIGGGRREGGTVNSCGCRPVCSCVHPCCRQVPRPGGVGQGRPWVPPQKGEGQRLVTGRGSSRCFQGCSWSLWTV